MAPRTTVNSNQGRPPPPPRRRQPKKGRRTLRDHTSAVLRVLRDVRCALVALLAGLWLVLTFILITTPYFLYTYVIAWPASCVIEQLRASFRHRAGVSFVQVYKVAYGWPIIRGITRSRLAVLAVLLLVTVVLDVAILEPAVDPRLLAFITATQQALVTPLAWVVAPLLGPVRKWLAVHDLSWVVDFVRVELQAELLGMAWEYVGQAAGQAPGETRVTPAGRRAIGFTIQKLHRLAELAPLVLVPSAIRWYLRVGMPALARNGYCADEDLLLNEAMLLVAINVTTCDDMGAMLRATRQLTAPFHPDRRVSKQGARVQACRSKLLIALTNITERVIEECSMG